MKYEAPLSDCYVIAPNRSAEYAMKFLDEFIPLRRITWDPSFSGEELGVSPTLSFEEILEHLEHNPESGIALYFWTTQSSPPWQAMLRFNGDGSLILGLSCDNEEGAESELLGRMEDFIGSAGCCLTEDPPARSREEYNIKLQLYQRGHDYRSTYR